MKPESWSGWFPTKVFADLLLSVVKLRLTERATRTTSVTVRKGVYLGVGCVACGRFLWKAPTHSIIRARFWVSHRKRGSKDIRFGSAILSPSVYFILDVDYRLNSNQQLWVMKLKRNYFWGYESKFRWIPLVYRIVIGNYTKMYWNWSIA
jgi:hypothetical protein